VQKDKKGMSTSLLLGLLVTLAVLLSATIGLVVMLGLRYKAMGRAFARVIPADIGLSVVVGLPVGTQMSTTSKL
jgi:hypothetical protein